MKKFLLGLVVGYGYLSLWVAVAAAGTLGMHWLGGVIAGWVGWKISPFATAGPTKWGIGLAAVATLLVPALVGNVTDMGERRREQLENQLARLRPKRPVPLGDLTKNTQYDPDRAQKYIK